MYPTLVTLDLSEGKPFDLQLEDGSQVAVIGGGPAGSFFSYFLLEMADRIGLDLQVDLYEPKDFDRPAPKGCNQCGGIVSESLVQNLATEGINLPHKVVQRGIDSYTLHMDVGSVHIETPLHEMRIGAVTRGPGPRDMKEMKWKSFDGQLQKLAEGKGAHIIREKVEKVGLENGRPQLKTRQGMPQTYDLVTVALGVNSPALKIFEALGLGYERPATTKTAIREYYLGEEVISQTLGSSMHVFLLNIPRLEFAALVPKGDYVTMCLLGEEIDAALLDAFVNAPEVRSCMPSDWDPAKRSCQCSPRINIQGVKKPYADRVLFIGDCGVTRLYKDGIGAAFRTAKAAASTAIFEGISEEAFRRHYMPLCRSIKSDNLLGKVTFAVTQQIQKMRFARKAVLRMTVDEQQKEGPERRMSGVLWDMFSGSAPYRDIFLRTLRPAFLGKFGWALAASLLPFNRHAKRHTARKRVLQ